MTVNTLNPENDKSKKVLIALNPLAGGGLVAEKTKSILESAFEEVRLEQGSEPFLFSEIEFFEDTPEALQKKLATSSQRYDRIIAAGGDGTITGVIAAALPHGLKVGIIPLGTGNRVASLFSIPTDPSTAIKIALGGVPYEMDVMSVNGNASILTADAGIGEAIMRSTNSKPLLKKILGILAYPLMALGPLISHRAVKFKLTFDNRTLVFKALGVAVVNAGEMAGFSITPDAKNNDGILDIAILAANGKLLKTIIQLLGQTPTTLYDHSGNGSSGLIVFQTREIVIDSAHPRRPINASIDGDPFGTTPLHIKLAGKVTVLVPKTS